MPRRAGQLEAPFTRDLGSSLDNEDLLALHFVLIDHQDAGRIMPGTGGFRKLRWGDETRGKENVVACASSMSFFPRITKCGCLRCTGKMRLTI